MTGALVAPGLSALARQMVAEIGEEDQERAEHAFLVAVRNEPASLPLWQHVAGIDWRAAGRLLRRAVRVQAALGVLAAGGAVWLAYAVFGAVPAVAAVWLAAGVAVCLLMQHAVPCVRGGGRHAR